MIRQGWPYFEGWPFPERWLHLDGLAIHYIDEGSGSHPVVMVHGNPAWSYMWRRLIPSVAGSGHRVLAFDLMGFGKSEKPDPDLHDFPHHARIVSSYIESLGLTNLVLIVHDWGGPFAMQYVVRHPQNVAGLIIMNTFLTADYRLPPQVAAKINPETIKESSVHPESIPQSTMDAYWAPFPDDEAKKVYQAFPRMFPDSPTHPSFKPLKEIEAGLPRLKIPTMVLWGTGRTAPTYAERVAKMIPTAKLTQVKAGHFVPEDAPDDVEKLILGFFSENSL